MAGVTYRTGGTPKAGSVTRLALAADVAAALVAPAGLRWGFLGDSITNGSTAGNIEYAYMMQAVAMAGGMVARRDSIESGVPGERADQMLARIDTLLDTGIQGLVVLTGANDAGQGRTVSQYAADLTSIIRKAKGRGIPVIVCTPPPRVAAEPATAHKLLQGYVAWINLIAPSLGADIADVYSALVGADGYLPAGMAADTVHPNALGHYTMAVPVARAMQRVARKSAGIITAPNPLNAIADPLNARALPTTSPWYEQPGGTGTAPTYSMVADASGVLPAGRWAEMAFDGTASGGTRRLAMPIGSVTPGDKWLIAAHIQVEAVTGDWVAGVTGGTASVDPIPVNQSGAGLAGSQPYYRCAGLPHPTIAKTYTTSPLWTVTIPAGATSASLWLTVKVPTGMAIKARFGCEGAINLTANGLDSLFDWATAPVSVPV